MAFLSKIRLCLLRLGNFFHLLDEKNNLNIADILCMILIWRIFRAPTLDFGSVSAVLGTLIHFYVKSSGASGDGQGGGPGMM